MPSRSASAARTAESRSRASLARSCSSSRSRAAVRAAASASSAARRRSSGEGPPRAGSARSSSSASSAASACADSARTASRSRAATSLRAASAAASRSAVASRTAPSSDARSAANTSRRATDSSRTPARPATSADCARRAARTASSRARAETGRGLRDPLELVSARPVAGGRLLLERRAQRARDVGRRLAPHLDALGGAPQPVERRRGRLAPPGRVAELVLGPRPLAQERLEPLLDVAPCERGGRPAALGLLQARVGRLDVELRDARPQPRDLDGELLGALGGRRLQGKGTQPLAHLLLHVARALDLDRDPRELELRTVLAPLEAPEPGGLLDQLAAPLRARSEHLLDPSLADDGVHASAEAEVGEELDEVDPAHGRSVQQVLALPAPVQAPLDRELRGGHRPVAGLVVEEELDLAVVGRPARRGAREEDVVGLLRAQLAGRQRPRGPDERVRDVGLARAVRPDHDGHARLEPDLDRVGERLEAAQLDRAQVHPGSLAIAADGLR